MAFIDGTALNVALPAVQAGLHASGAQLLWIVNAYLLMLAAFILVGGSLGDKYGRKKIFMLGIALFIVASLVCGISPSIQWMISARILQGIGGALMIPGSLAIISASLQPNRRGRAIGTWSAATTLVTVVGPVLGGILADHGLWRMVFLINPPLGMISLVALHFKVPESRDESSSGSIDYLGAGLLTIGLAGFTYGFISAPKLGFQNPLVLGTLLFGIFALVIFGFVESFREHPLVPFRLFKSRTFTGSNLLTLFLYGALSAVTFFLSLNLVQVQGYTKTEAGFAFLPFVIILISMSRWAGGLVDRSGPRLPLIIGPTLVGLGFFWMSFAGLTSGPSTYWTTFFPGIVLFGIGMGFTVAPLSTSVMSSVPTQHSGTASGINNAVSRTAGVLAIAIAGSIALFAFSNSLMSRTADLNLTDQARNALKAQAQNLSGATVPAGIGQENTSQVETSIKQAFVDTFRLVTILCAIMAWISAVAAAMLVEARLHPEPE